MNYQDALIEALTNKELIESYDRLTESKLAVCLQSIQTGLQIDLATGCSRLF